MSFRVAASAGIAQTFASMALSFLSIKITSVYLGPAGIAALGQIAYFVALTQGLLAAGLHTGLVRRYAELGSDQQMRDRTVSTVATSLLVISLPAALGIALASRWLAKQLLNDATLSFSFLVCAGALAFGLMSMVITACANGAKDFKALTFINVGTGVASLLLIATLVPSLGLDGGLFATAVLPILTFAIAWALARRREWRPRHFFTSRLAVHEMRSLSAFVPLAIVTTVGMPLLQLLVRDSVMSHSGMASVGLFQGVTRISDMYLAMFSSVLGMYFFPRFSEIADPELMEREVRRGLFVIVPSVACISVAIYLLRDLVVRLVFTSEFLPMRELFGWQMLGNVLKIVGGLFGYVLLAKSSALMMALLELGTLAVWWVASTQMIAMQGVIGAPQAYAMTYALYSILTFIGARRVVRRMRSAPQAA